MSFYSIKPFFLIGLAIDAALGICVALSVVWAMVASLLFLLSVSVFLIKKPCFSNYLIILIFVFLLFGVRTYFQVEKNKQDVESWIHGAHRYDDFIKQTSASSVPISMPFFVLDTVFSSNQSSVLAESVSDGRRVLIQLSLNTPRLFYGDVVEIRGAWSYPRPTRNPGVADTQKRYLYAGISGKVYPQTMVKVDHRLGNPIKQVALYLKDRVLKQHKNSLPYPYSDLLTSFIFGESGTVLPDDISENFQRTGLTHVLVVSGAQVTLLCGIVFQILTFFSLGRGSSTAIMGSVCAVFYFLSGAGTSVLRAVVMAMVALGFQLFYYRASIFHIISFTFLMMALINPFLVMDIGAQLSFMATFSLVFGSRTLEEALPLKWPGWLRIGVAVSIAPFLFTSPIILYHFHRVSVVSVVTNFLSMQIVEWVVVIGFFSTAIGFASFYVADVLNHGLYYLLFVLNMGTKWVSKSSLAVWHIPMGVVAVFLWYGVLLVTFYAIRLRTNSDFEKSKKVFKGVTLFCAGGFCLIFIWAFFLPKN